MFKGASVYVVANISIKFDAEQLLTHVLQQVRHLMLLMNTNKIINRLVYLFKNDYCGLLPFCDIVQQKRGGGGMRERTT